MELVVVITPGCAACRNTVAAAHRAVRLGKKPVSILSIPLDRASDYNVSSVPTVLLIDDDNAEIGRFEGQADAQEISTMLNAAYV